MTLFEIPVLGQGILNRDGIKRLVRKIKNAFPKLILSRTHESLMLDVPGHLPTTTILERAEADFANERLCCLHEFTYVGDRVPTFYICEDCKEAREASLYWSYPDQYDRLAWALDDLAEAAAEIPMPVPMPKLVKPVPEPEWDSYEEALADLKRRQKKVAAEALNHKQPTPFHLGGALKNIERIT